jgi:hypothetical protein
MSAVERHDPCPPPYRDEMQLVPGEISERARRALHVGTGVEEKWFSRFSGRSRQTVYGRKRGIK